MNEMKKQDFPVLKSKRLILRQCLISDADELFNLAKDPKLTVNLSWENHKNINETCDFIESIQNTENKFIWAICNKNNNKIMGIIDLRISIKNSMGEMGYWIGVPYWNKGYMTEVVKSVIKFAFDVLNLNRIQALHFLSNPASGRVMEKCNMVFEGILREYLFHKVYHDCKIYSILRKDR